MTEQVWPADQVRRWPISQLREYNRNARTHSESQIQKIADSITECGWTMPILAGHGWLEAARVLGARRGSGGGRRELVGGTEATTASRRTG